MDLGDDLGVDDRDRTVAILTGSRSFRRADRCITDCSLVDPLLGLSRLDLFLFVLGGALGAAGAAGLANLGGTTLCLVAWLRPAAVLLAALPDRATPLGTWASAVTPTIATA